MSVEEITLQMPPQLKEPDTPDPFHKLMSPKWDKIRTVLGGTQNMRDAKEKFTPKFDQESDTDYARRLQKTHLTNMLADSIENAVSKPFSKPLTVDKEESNEEYVQFSEDIDRQGTDLNTFAATAFYTGIGDGKGYLLVDAPSTGGRALSVAEEKKENIRPYMLYIDAVSMISYRSSLVKGSMRPTYIKYVSVSTDFNEQDAAVTVRKVHQIQADTDDKAGYFRVYEKRDKKKWQIIDEGPYQFDQVTIEPIFFGKNHEQNQDVYTPPFMDLCETNIAHWNSQSDQNNILEHSRFAMYHFKGMDKPVDADGDETEIAMGPGSYIYSPPSSGDGAGASIEAITLPTDGLIQGWEDLNRKMDDMKMLGLDPSTPANSGMLTASERIIDEKKANSALANWATQFAKSFEHAFEFMGLWANLTDPTKIKVNINTEFGVTEHELSEIKMLREMHTMGQLSLETLLEETKRRQVFDTEFDTIRELARISDEQPNYEEDYSAPKIPPGKGATDKQPGRIVLPKPAVAA